MEWTRTVLHPQLLQRCPGIAGRDVEDIAQQGDARWLGDRRGHRYAWWLNLPQSQEVWWKVGVEHVGESCRDGRWAIQILKKRRHELSQKRGSSKKLNRRMHRLKIDFG